ncbi:hypothetical protein BJX99DRAFT_255964 [Aspergillus californicus]
MSTTIPSSDAVPAPVPAPSETPSVPQPPPQAQETVQQTIQPKDTVESEPAAPPKTKTKPKPKSTSTSSGPRLQNDFGADLWVRKGETAKHHAPTAGRGLFAGLQDQKQYTVQDGWAKRNPREAPGLFNMLFSR